MEIVECTKRRLVLRKDGRIMRVCLLAGLGLLLFAGVFFYQIARTASVRCVRHSTGLTCDMTEKLLGVIPLEHRHFEDVKGADTDSVGDSEHESYFVELEIEGSYARPLSDVVVAEWECDLFVERFTAFARSRRRADNFLQLPDPMQFVVMCVLFGPLLILLTLFGWPYRLEVDRDQGCLSIREGITKKASYPFADVVDIEVQAKNEDGRIVGGVYLLLKSGERVQLLVGSEVVALLGDYVPRRSS
jgi:hypothetical protein